MLTLATTCFIRILLNSGSKLEGELYPVGMWFVAILLDFTLLVGALVFFGA